MTKRDQSHSVQLELFDVVNPPATSAPASTTENTQPAPTSDGGTARPQHKGRSAPESQKAGVLHQELVRGTKMAIHLTITNNKRVMMSVRHAPDGQSARVRLHHMFLSATDDVRRALAHWIKHPRAKKHDALFRSFFNANNNTVHPPASRKPRLRMRGLCYNLREIFDELNRQYFNGAIKAAISWGFDRGQRIRSIRFGSYFPQERLIRIHPRLDQPFVPPYMVRYIVYHEMLHAYLGIESGRHGRRRIHPPEFNRLEAAFPEYEKAIAWIKNKDSMKRILRTRR